MSERPLTQTDQRLRSAARDMRGEWKDGGKGAWLVTHGAVRCHEGLSERERHSAFSLINENKQHPLMTINNVSKEASHRNATGVIDQGRQKVAPMIKLGLDVHIASIVAMVREGALPPKPARRLSREQLLALVRQQVERGAAL